jgi:hypothetical protein
VTIGASLLKSTVSNPEQNETPASFVSIFTGFSSELSRSCQLLERERECEYELDRECEYELERDLEMLWDCILDRDLKRVCVECVSFEYTSFSSHIFKLDE